MAKASEGRESKKAFLYPDIFFEGLMIVQVVLGDIAEQAAGIFQAGDPVLMDGVGAGLHENMGTAGVCHFFQQGVEVQGVGGGMRSRHDAVADMVLLRC
jgi:hypothetical protein